MNADELIRLHIGNLVVQIVTLQAEAERLRVENENLKTVGTGSEKKLKVVEKLDAK